MKSSVLISGLLLASLSCSSEILLPAVFADHMVLERQSKVAVWGWSNSAETIKINGSWNGDTVTTKASAEGYWMAELPTGAAGGPYTLTIKGNSETKTLTDVMLGEVWLCSGQSNMEFTANWGLDNKQAEVAKADFPGIRFFHVPKRGAPYPQEFTKASWVTCTPQTMPNQTAVGYYFARLLHQTLHVPVGIIESDWGGSSAEVWIRPDRISTHNHFDENGWVPVKPGVLYNGMIYPVVPYGIAGVLWYQGETNTTFADNYAVVLDSLVTGWRRDFKKDVPFYYVQIAPFAYDSTKQPAYILREQEDLAQQLIPNSGMVSIGDIAGDIHDIHPKNKLDVGERLARYALAETYNHPIGPYKNPTLKSAQTSGNKIILTVANADGGLITTDKNIPNFQIAGEDGQYVTAKADIKGDKIEVTSPQVSAPLTVRYCFTNSAVPTIFSKNGHLPLAPFRTDKKSE